MKQGRLAIAAAMTLGAILAGTTTGHAQGKFNTVNGTGSNAPTFDPTSFCNTVNNDGTHDTTELGQFAACNTINNDATSFGDVTDIIASSFNRVNNSDSGAPFGGHNTTVIEGGSSFNTVTHNGGGGAASFNHSSFNNVSLGTSGNADTNVATLTNSNGNTVTLACDGAPVCISGFIPGSPAGTATLTNVNFSTVQAYGTANVATIQNGAFDKINIGTLSTPVENDAVTITGSFDTVNDPYSNTDVVVSGNGVTLDCTGVLVGAVVIDTTIGTTSEPC